MLTGTSCFSGSVLGCGQAGVPAVMPGGRGVPLLPWGCLLVGTGRSCWSAGVREEFEPIVGGEEHVGPGPVVSKP